MKLIIAGSRTFQDEKLMAGILDNLHELGWITLPLEGVFGMARGADMVGYNLFKKAGLVCHEFPADWNGPHKHGAGFVRNADMGRFADALVAFWDGESRGTKHMIEFMMRLQKPVQIVRFNP